MAELKKENANKTRILLADDHQMFCNGLRRIIESDPAMQVVGEAHNGRSALEKTGECQPQLVVMDVGMPDLNGMDATRMILEKHPRINVIGLSMFRETRYVQGMFEAGASGYVLKDCAAEELLAAIKTILSGGQYISPSLSGAVMASMVEPSSEVSLLSSLSPREREVLQLIAEGSSTKDIAVKLSIADRTVATHRENIMSKLNLHTVAELTRFAIKEGLSPL